MLGGPIIRTDDRNSRLFLWLILAAGAAARIITALIADNINDPDEIFQILEQAHRVVFGYGIIPWEYRLSARSWLVPGIMTIFLYPFKLLGLGNPNIYIPGMKIIMSLLSMSIVLSAYYIGKRLLSHRAGLWAAFFCAVWYEIIYFSIRPLSEVWAAIFFMAALALSLKTESHRALIVGGFLAVMTAAVRINYVPAAAVLILLIAVRLDSAARLKYLIGAAAAVVFVGLFETVTLGIPFISYVNFYEYGKTLYMAGPFGSSFSFEYLMSMACASLFMYWLIFAGGIVFWRDNRLLTVIIIVVLVSHILIPAKKHELDYRSIFVIIPVLLVSAGLIADRIMAYLKPFRLLHILLILIIPAVSVVGAMAALPFQNKIYHNKVYTAYSNSIFHKNGRLQAYRYLYDLDNIVTVFDNSGEWYYGGGYYYLHRNVPLYLKATPPPSPKYVSHLLSQNRHVIVSGIRYNKSFGEFYLHTRPDTGYIYPVDSTFTCEIPQAGIDDSLNISGGQEK